jgi:hypothetical protein
MAIGLLGGVACVLFSQDKMALLNSHSKDLKLYQSKHYHYQIYIPPGFQYFEMGSQYGRYPDFFVLFAEKDLNLLQQRRSGQFVLTIRDDIKSLDEYLQKRQALLKRLNAEISEKPVAVGGLIGVQLGRMDPYDCLDLSNPRSLDLLPCRSFTTIWQKGGLIYEFSGTVFGDGDYQKYFELYTQMLSTFRLID